MKLHWIGGLALTTALAGAAWQRGLGQVDESIEGGSYTNSRGDTTEVVGVCHVTETTLDCWGPKREPAPELEKMVRESLKARSDQSSPLAFRFNAKNRLVIVRSTGRDYSTNVNTNRTNGNGYSNIQLREPLADAPSGYSTRYTVLNLAFEQDATTTFVDLEENVPVSIDESIKLGVGSKFKIMGLTATLGKATKGQDQSYGSASPRYQWNVPFDLSEPTKVQLSGSGQPYDKTGARIEGFRIDGKPMTKKEFAAERARQGSPAYFGSATPQASFYLEAGSDHGYFSLSFDPAFVEELRVSCNRRRVVRLAGIPLDPKTP